MERKRRLPGREELDVVGREDGQLVLGDRDDPVLLAVHDRDGATPEALPRDEPVPQPKVDLPLSQALLLEPFDGAVLRRRDVESVEEPAVDLDAVAGIRTAPFGFPVLRRLNGAHDGQPMQRGERPVSLVLGRHRHDRSGSVAHEDVVGHIERDRVAAEGIDHVAAREGAALLQGARIALGHALDVGLRCRTLPELVDGGALLGQGQRVHERVLRGHDGVGHAEAGVGAGGEDPELQLGTALARGDRTRPPRSARSSSAA